MGGVTAAGSAAMVRRAVSLETLRPLLLREPPLLPLAPTRGDFDLNPDQRPRDRRELSPAAVLIPIVVRDEPQILFTRRTEHLPRHAGQVSFPGGRSHENDISLVETALRETQEETGITPGFVTVAGFLDAYETGTGYAILPVVGLLAEGFSLSPDANEVAHIFEVPLAFLLDPANRERQTREFQGRMRSFYSFSWQDQRIWGATAAMLVNLAERLNA
ncbi:MAG: CoA pyrophosphatase [Alphaproteobacteria bacterium]|nr:CoA pyrophosphatase [Alphaproteobacteria bacterium]